GEPVEVIPSQKMSKSKKNVVDPADIIREFGADTARWFILSDSPPERDVEWTAAGAEAAHRHLARVWRMADEVRAALAESGGMDAADDPAAAELDRAAARAIADVTENVEGFAFNKAVARLYEFTNTVHRSKAGPAAKARALRTMAQLMAPMTPHIAEEIWSILGGEGLVVATPWPEADPALLVEDTVTLPIQVNGKRRAEISVPKDLPKDEIERLAIEHEAVQRALGGATPRKVIVVPGRIVNVVA
ncbi:MAG: leucine--tRNA ligase, partial [Alphaproteobacteria bacterium]